MKSNIKKSSTKNRGEDRWVVATEKVLEEARVKGLAKDILDLAGKEEYRLCSTHIHVLIWLVGDEIQRKVGEFLEEKHKGFSITEQYHYVLEDLLYIIEDLLPYHFYKKDGSFTYGDDLLIKQLKMIKEIVAFPPEVEAFYRGYIESKQMESLN